MKKNIRYKKIILISEISVLSILVVSLGGLMLNRNIKSRLPEKNSNKSNKIEGIKNNTKIKSSSNEQTVTNKKSDALAGKTGESSCDNPKTNSNKVIVIDPGHANRSNLKTEPEAPGSSIMKMIDGGGAQGVGTNTPEYIVNMKVSMKLKALLEARGYTVIMTKTLDSESPTNAQRAEVGNNAHAALEIRIHADSSESSSISGASMLVPASINSNTSAIHDESKRCGGIILDALVNEVHMNNRGVVERNDLTGFNWSNVPVVLIEMGFLSNYKEDVLLSSDDYQTKLASGLADGISNAVK